MQDLIRKNNFEPHINPKEYEDLYQKSISNPDKFWAEQAEKFISFDKKWDKISDYSFNPENVYIKWFEGSKLNLCYNAVDRHLASKGNQTAIIWEGDNPNESKKITYQQLHKEVCKFANILKSNGVKKGDVVTIYLPMILEAAYAMLACARIGAVHSVVFAGFSSEALRGRIEDGKSKFVITTNFSNRGGKKIPLLNNVLNSISNLDNIKILLIDNQDKNQDKIENVISYSESYKNASDNCPYEIMDAESPLFILYTSGSTGKPKGLLHTTAGYGVYTAMTFKYVFDYQDGDIYFCTADIGWITGHSYVIYAPLINGGITLMFEGVPTYPDYSRFWQIIDKHKVTQFYTAPTAIRMLMGAGDELVKNSSRESLRILGSVGEPINPEAWRWYHKIVGNENCPIVDTWWQTETGGFLITPLPYATKLKAGSATKPFFGIIPAIVNDKNEVIGGLEGEKDRALEGNLCILNSWPSQARTIWSDHQRFVETYFKPFPNKYFSGDGAKLDEDGYFWITGRVDDVINVSGHRLGTAEIESALILHKNIAEAAVVGYPHDIKGQGIYAFVTLKDNAKISDNISLINELKDIVAKEISPIAKPDLIQLTKALPKTRSGKIMRRILRKIAENNFENLGDTRTLLNPEAVDEIINNRLNANN